jgi:hypothetical protein
MGKRFRAILRNASSHAATSVDSGKRSANSLKPSCNHNLTNAEALEQLSEACSRARHHRVNSRAEYTHCGPFVENVLRLNSYASIIAAGRFWTTSFTEGSGKFVAIIFVALLVYAA